MANISDYLYRKASINKIPINGTFELSPVCNFTCKMCYIRKTAAQLKKDGKELIDWKKWLELAKECRDAGMLFLLLTGGEPFIYPGFKELYQELHKMGFLISLNTNGTLIDDETIEWLKEAAPHRVNITLYGASLDTYENICGNGAAYKKVTETILKLKEAGITVVINASMIPENEKDLEGIIQFGKKHDIFTRIATYMFPPVRRESEANDSRSTPEQSADMFVRKNRCLLEGAQWEKFIKNQLESLQKAGENFEEEWGGDPEYMKCRAGRSTFWVSWEGKMTACGMMPFPIEVYPFERPFQDCWMELTDEVGKTRVLKECSSCSKKEICNPCAAMLYAEEGDVNRKSSYMCELADRMIEKIKSEQQESV